MIKYSNIVIEKDEAKDIIFSDISYTVLKDFKNHDIIGVCKVRRENDALVADFSLNSIANGLYPAIGYTKKGKEIHLWAVGLCEQRNLDETIEPL